ncbi:MAG: type II toxin-antitoxin system RelE/ParE family toxin [Dehalococcoidia bacterium]
MNRLSSRGTEDLFDGSDTRAARRACPRAVWPVVRRKLDQINRVRDIRELTVPPGNRLERLRGDRSGQYSIRDPFDRLLVAQSMAQRLAVATRDPRVRDYEIDLIEACVGTNGEPGPGAASHDD